MSSLVHASRRAGTPFDLANSCPAPLDFCSPVCPLGALCCLTGAPGDLALLRCAGSVRGAACVVSWATSLLFTCVRSVCCVVSGVGRPGPLGSCSAVCLLGALRFVCAVLSHLAPVHRCACTVRSVACADCWATWLLFIGVPVPCVTLRVPCPGPLGSYSLVCSLGALCCVCPVLGHLAPVHGVPARCVALRLRCPGPLGSYSPVCSLGALCGLCGVLGHLAAVHRSGRSLCCGDRAVTWATWMSGLSLRGAHSSIRMAALRSWQVLGTPQARRRPSGRQLVRSRQGLGTLPGAHLSIRTADVPLPLVLIVKKNTNFIRSMLQCLLRRAETRLCAQQLAIPSTTYCGICGIYL